MLSVENIYFGVIWSFGTCHSVIVSASTRMAMGTKIRDCIIVGSYCVLRIFLAFGFLPKKNSIIKMHKAVYIFICSDLFHFY